VLPRDLKRKLDLADRDELVEIIQQISTNVEHNQRLEKQFFKLEQILFSAHSIVSMMQQIIHTLLSEFQLKSAVVVIPENSVLSNFFSTQESIRFLPIDICRVLPVNWHELTLFPYSHEAFKIIFPEQIAGLLHSAVLIPLRHKMEPVGLLCVGSEHEEHFSQQMQNDYLWHFALKLELGLDNLIFQDQLERTWKEKHELAQQLGRQNQELLELNQMKDQLLSVAAHDLRSPLTGIIGLAELMVADPSLNSRYYQWLTTMITSGRRQLQFINELLSVIKFQNGQLRINRRQMNIVAMWQQVIQENYPHLVHKNLEARLITTFSEMLIDADGDKLRQVCHNLLYNAIKFSYKNQIIEIELDCSPPDQYLMQIRDNGMGWEAGNELQFFQPFTPMARQGTEGEVTTGLGLSICKNIVSLHGGKMDCHSPGPEQGATFSVYLPVSTPSD